MALIEIRDVCKVYNLGEVKVDALKNAQLTIEQGEYVALIGPSGSGKSTLMNTLGCLDRPTSGSYKLAGEEIATMSNDDRARIRNQRIGFVFQNFNLSFCIQKEFQPPIATGVPLKNCRWWVSEIDLIIIPVNFRVVSNSESRLPALWLTSRQS